MSLRKALNGVLAGWGLSIERSTPQVLKTEAKLNLDFDSLVRCEIQKQNGNFCFIQIGANDGQSRADDLGCYIQEFETVGIMVEPQPDVFLQLEQNYSNSPGIALLNKAVHLSETSMTLYRFDPDMLQDRADLPLWARTNGIASFSRQHVLDHAKKLNLSPDTISDQDVDCITVDDLFSQISRVPDLLKIDVEGYDFEILNALDLNRYRPRLIRFENLHMPDKQYQSIIDRFHAAGYRFLANRMDTTAYLVSE